jgi:hypothetical protein
VLQDEGGHHHSYVAAINDSGYSVGESNTAFAYEAVLWSPSGKATNLGAVLGSAWTDTEAVGINNSGDIIGYGDYHDGQYGFLLTPESLSALSATAAPELSTWGMLVVGLAGLGVAGCRRAQGRGFGRPIIRLSLCRDPHLHNVRRVRGHCFGSPREVSRVHWIQPRLDGLLRQTVYVGLREDKPASEVRRETPLAAETSDLNSRI